MSWMASAGKVDADTIQYPVQYCQTVTLEMEAYLRYEKAFERIVSSCPADEYDPDEV